MTIKKKKLVHIGIALLLLAVGAAGMAALTATKPDIEKKRIAHIPSVVRTIKVATKTQELFIPGEGTVGALREINLVPEVSGKVIYMSDSLVNGGSFLKDDVLLKIDPRDYETAVKVAQAKVKDAESALKMVQEEAYVAREEWKMHVGSTSKRKSPPPLVAKVPQLAAARAALDGAKADYNRTKLNLSRTEIKAPFAGKVSAKMVDIGQYTTPGQTLARLFSTEAVEIVLPMEDGDLLWFDVPGFTTESGSGSKAVVKGVIAGRPMTWEGMVVRAEGRLDERTRMVNVVVRVEEPYKTYPPLAVGLFVKVEIQGRRLEKIAAIPRHALRAGDIVWVVGDDDKLVFRQVEIARIIGDLVYVRAGLNDGDVVVISNLKAVTDGMTVRPVGDELPDEPAKKMEESADKAEPAKGGDES